MSSIGNSVPSAPSNETAPLQPVPLVRSSGGYPSISVAAAGAATHLLPKNSQSRRAPSAHRQLPPFVNPSAAQTNPQALTNRDIRPIPQDEKFFNYESAKEPNPTFFI